MKYKTGWKITKKSVVFLPSERRVSSEMESGYYGSFLEAPFIT